MLKKMSIKKIMVASSAAVILMIMYLLPDANNKEIDTIKSGNTYTYDNIVNTIYLVDSEDYVSRTSIASVNGDSITIAKDLLGGLIIGGSKENIIPNGFRSIIPSGTILLDAFLNNKTLTIDFSKEFLDVPEKDEEKMIESIIYTLTSINGIDSVIIKVEGKVLESMPSGRRLPGVLNRDYGINKSYNLVNTKNIDSYTMYYVNTYNDYEYYVPVTKYVNNNNEDKVKVIIKELSSSPIYETNLMSYLNANTEVYDYELTGNNLKLNFNNSLLYDEDSNKILEEVIYTIGLSMDDMYDNLEEVSFYVNNEEIYTLNLNEIK